MADFEDFIPSEPTQEQIDLEHSAAHIADCLRWARDDGLEAEVIMAATAAAKEHGIDLCELFHFAFMDWDK